MIRLHCPRLQSRQFVAEYWLSNLRMYDHLTSVPIKGLPYCDEIDQFTRANHGRIYTFAAADSPVQNSSANQSERPEIHD